MDMATIPADGVEIVTHEGFFQLLPGNVDLLTRRPLFEAAHGAGVMQYSAEFGKAHHLPGTVLSVEFIQAVVIGCDEKSQRWLLGFNVRQQREDDPEWLELARWPFSANEQHARAAQHAGRHLAETLGCPLRIFGAKKLPATDPARQGHGVTGPLTPHQREDFTPERVRVYAQSVRFPVQYPGMWLGQTKEGVTLRQAKDSEKARHGVSPAYNQCVINKGAGVIRLIPPTGLLGAFFGGQQGRSIPTGDVRNVELRLTIGRESSSRQDGEDLITEVTHTTYTWGVYLTLSDESLLLAHTAHATSSELTRQRAMAGDKFAVDTRSTMEYLRQHQEDQGAYEAAETFARTVAVVVANTLGTRVVKTQVDSDDL